jgi:HTH-type transcriptional regulator, sugar sensing transcriptional regulator
MWSDDPAVALVAAEYVRHDIALQLIGDRLREAGLEEFWRTDPELERLRASAAVIESLRTQP